MLERKNLIILIDLFIILVKINIYFCAKAILRIYIISHMRCVHSIQRKMHAKTYQLYKNIDLIL